jgi:hypothetical protein
VLDLSEMKYRPKSFQCFGWHCWHCYSSNPAVVSLSVSADKNSFYKWASLHADLKAGVQLFIIDPITIKYKYLKIEILESFGASRAYMNQVFLYEEIPPSRFSKCLRFATDKQSLYSTPGKSQEVSVLIPEPFHETITFREGKKTTNFVKTDSLKAKLNQQILELQEEVNFIKMQKAFLPEPIYRVFTPIPQEEPEHDVDHSQDEEISCIRSEVKNWEGVMGDLKKDMRGLINHMTKLQEHLVARSVSPERIPESDRDNFNKSSSRYDKPRPIEDTFSRPEKENSPVRRNTGVSPRSPSVYSLAYSPDSVKSVDYSLYNIRDQLQQKLKEREDKLERLAKHKRERMRDLKASNLSDSDSECIRLGVFSDTLSNY